MKVRPEVCASLIVDCGTVYGGYMYVFMAMWRKRGAQFMVDWLIREGNVGLRKGIAVVERRGIGNQCVAYTAYTECYDTEMGTASRGLFNYSYD